MSGKPCLRHRQLNLQPSGVRPSVSSSMSPPLYLFFELTMPCSAGCSSGRALLTPSAASHRRELQERLGIATMTTLVSSCGGATSTSATGRDHEIPSTNSGNGPPNSLHFLHAGVQLLPLQSWTSPRWWIFAPQPCSCGWPRCCVADPCARRR